MLVSLFVFVRGFGVNKLPNDERYISGRQRPNISGLRRPEIYRPSPDDRLLFAYVWGVWLFAVTSTAKTNHAYLNI